MTVSETLEQTWSSVVAEASQAEGYYHRRIPLVALWPAHAGIHRPTGARILILETDSKALRGLSLRDENRGYTIDIGADEAKRTDRASIRIVEISKVYREIFTIFCADIVEHWCPHASADDSLKSLTHRLGRWKKFFQRGAQLGLSREDYIGLFGELSFIEAGLEAGLTAPALIDGWQNPPGANQDFHFGPLAVEIKTTTANDIDLVRISNVRQLDSTGLSGLFLGRYAFDFRLGSGRTLPQLVASLKNTLSTAAHETLSAFCDRLLEAGFIEGAPSEFDAWGFTLRQFTVFKVLDGFPRLVESNLPSGISEVSYNLNLAVAAPFHVATADFWIIISSPNG